MVAFSHQPEIVLDSDYGKKLQEKADAQEYGDSLSDGEHED